MEQGGLTMCKAVCKVCPFKKDSMQGYLGPHTTEEILDVMQFDMPFACHPQRRDDPQETEALMLKGEVQICRGYVASASKSAKMFGQHPVFGKQMRDLQLEITAEDKEVVLNRWNFKKYHDD